MNFSILEFSQKCLLNIDHDYLAFFDLKNGEIPSFSTYPQEWCEYYLEQKYHESDYVLLKKSFLPFAWGEKILAPNNSLQKKIFKDAQDFQIAKGITAHYKSLKSYGAITLAFHKGGRFRSHELCKLSSDLYFACQMIATYLNLLEAGDEAHDAILQLINELSSWQKDCQRQKAMHAHMIIDVLSDIRAAQMFISHHETKELGLQTLHKTYHDIERLI